MSSTSRGISPKHGGSRAEDSVLDAVPQLRFVPDTEARHYDAVVDELLSPSLDLPMVGLCLLAVGTIVEIKSAMVVVGESQSNGRFYLRKSQHSDLVDEAGVYLFAVCEPTPQRDVIAMKVIPATCLDDVISTWIECEGRATYAQILWTRLFSNDEVSP
ncbi:hypothetical protein [Halogranum rubrum]|uniref:Uncharacterized protein n=1 Tax=Halogranum salarium B-1 TaxID=1210908 RepID=J3JI55_9EURY|nr:hypothetical protein [Halogranum salarium]EJN61579.1 hypothetical protein HSB1_06200 [Halogranum salarium B-1]